MRLDSLSPTFRIYARTYHRRGLLFAHAPAPNACPARRIRPPSRSTRRVNVRSAPSFPACERRSRASLVEGDDALLGAARRAHLQVDDAPVPLRDLIERGVGEVEVRDVPAAPALVARVGVLARARVGDLDGDGFLPRVRAPAPGAEVGPLLPAGRAVDAYHLEALTALIRQAPVVPAVGVPAVCDGRASRTGEGEMSDERGGSVGVGSSRRLFVGRRTAVRRGGRSRGAARGGK